MKDGHISIPDSISHNLANTAATKPIGKIAWLAAAAALTILPVNGALACSIFPEQYAVDHKTLVERTARIALVRAVHVSVNARSVNGKVVFEVKEALKGKFDGDVTLEHSAWLHKAPEDAHSDFDRHRDADFWPSTTQHRVPLGRSLGIRTDCEIGYHFAPGLTYLGFFDGDRPNHVQAFELIKSKDDRWLATVRSLVAK